MRDRSRTGTIGAVLAASVVAVVGLHGTSWPHPPQDRDAAGSRRAFVRQIHQSLKAIDARMTAVAAHELALPQGGRRDADGWIALRIQEKSAESAYQKARLDREIAEITILEYKEGVYVQDLASVEGEIGAAREGIGTARGSRTPWPSKIRRTCSASTREMTACRSTLPS